MPTATDTNRIAQAHTPLGPKLVFRELTGSEELSRIFEYQLELLAESDSGVDPKALLGQSMTAEIAIQGGGSRFVDGQCTRFAYAGTEYSREHNTILYRYQARLRSWTWYMTLTSTCRIFQNKTVPDIVREVLDQYPFPADFRLSRSYREWEYCVQYQETDWNFVSRLLEHEGIYTFFEHALGNHTLVLADDIGAHSSLPGYSTIPHIPPDLMVIPDEEYIHNWTMAQEVDSGQFATDDYDFKNPSGKLAVISAKALPFPHGSYEIFDWPGGYWKVPDGEQYARTRIEELQQPQETTSAQGNARGLAAGYLFTLERCPRRDQNREYLLLGVSLFVRDNPYHSGVGPPAEWQFSFVAQPTTRPYRPRRTTAKPHTTGPQTAVVVGPSGEEIYTDEYGRVKVKFHWDRTDYADERSSCWIRVSSGWAGSNWGQISIPRIGQEVIVDFLNGDPDYPIIIGRVYNAEHKPPYALPRWKEYSTVKSRSTKGGGNNDWNEIRFYDYKGKEQVFIQAQWRYDLRVKWNKYETVLENSHFNTRYSCYFTTGGDLDQAVHGKLHLRADKGADVTFGDTLQVVGENNVYVTADSNLELNVGMNTVIETGMTLTLKGSGGFITIDPSGVTIQGTMVKINSGGSASGSTKYDADHPYDAQDADTGEPGYLDKPKKPGGWAKRKSSKGGHHRAMPPLPAPRPTPVVPPVPPTPPAAKPIPGTLGPYATQDEAAKAGLNAANPTSIKENREYGGLIVKDPKTGSYYATNPSPGTGDSFDPSAVKKPAGTDTVGDYHTHGDYSKKGADGKPVRASKAEDQYNSDNFSSTDKKGIADDAKGKPGYAGYLGTPSGTFRKYDPATKKDEPF